MDAISSLSNVSAVREYSTASPQAVTKSKAVSKGEFAKIASVASDAEKVNPASNKAQAAMAFETMVLSQFIGEIFKEQASGAFGEGVQGDFYASIFSDAISKQLSEAGAIGISKLV